MSVKRTAVLWVDVVNHMHFPGGDKLAEQAAPIVPRLRALRARAHRAGVPVIYANDNFGRWTATSREIIAYCSQRRWRGSSFTRALAPTRRDHFVLKARNSAFYCTSLEPLLESLKVEKLVLCGLTTDNCVLFTAHDAYLRGYRLHVPRDCVAAQTAEATERALEQLGSSISLKADTRPSTAIRWRS